MIKMNDLIRKLVFREKSSSDSYIQYLRKKGMKIGEDVKFYSPENTTVDEQYPWMISIGNHVRITQGVILLTHDYSWSVLKRYASREIDEGVILGASGFVTIGDNVFIGMHTVVLRNVHIGNNVIIGAGSVVTKDCLDNGVYAGNPAKRVMELEDFYSKRQNVQIQEAVDLARRYYERFGKRPERRIFHEYFMLFSDSEQIADVPIFAEKMKKCKNENASKDYVKKHKPVFENFEEFMTYCFDKENEDE